MTDAERMAFVVRVLAAYDRADQHDSLFWRVIDGRLKLLAMCNDSFWWGTSDAEEITPENVGALDQALVDLQALNHLFATMYLSDLFAARVRGMRPQRPRLADIEKHVGAPAVALFMDCGPERDPKEEG